LGGLYIPPLAATNDEEGTYLRPLCVGDAHRRLCVAIIARENAILARFRRKRESFGCIDKIGWTLVAQPTAFFRRRGKRPASDDAGACRAIRTSLRLRQDFAKSNRTRVHVRAYMWPSHTKQVLIHDV
jgi:hypothetical protein